MQLVTITIMNAQINSNEINEILIGPGSLSVDLNNDGLNDYTFEILTLSPGVLAARVVTLNTNEFLDNSTYGYPDALNEGEVVDGYFNNGNGVLGTFNTAAYFNGAGDKFLGLKINPSGSQLLGWIKLYCSTDRDTLKIISGGYNNQSLSSIYAGDLSTVSIEENTHTLVSVYPNPLESYATIQLNTTNDQAEIVLCDGTGRFVKRLNNFTGNQFTLYRGDLAEGVYFLVFSFQNQSRLIERIVVVD
jgi:hypothetical protein